jgi:hypothetical protein
VSCEEVWANEQVWVSGTASVCVEVSWRSGNGSVWKCVGNVQCFVVKVCCEWVKEWKSASAEVGQCSIEWKRGSGVVDVPCM